MDIYIGLNKILLLHQERKQIIQKVQSCVHKKRAGILFEISPDDKAKTIHKANQIYDAKIAAVYVQLNKQLSKDGKPLLINPFEREDKENEIGTCKENRRTD